MESSRHITLTTSIEAERKSLITLEDAQNIKFY
jgi:hypothetical protein